VEMLNLEDLKEELRWQQEIENTSPDFRRKIMARNKMAKLKQQIKETEMKEKLMGYMLAIAIGTALAYTLFVNI
jgi:hypothetical protein